MNNDYPLNNLTKEQREKAYEFACDTRKFEIELYWKRATYFWGFLIVTFGGYLIALEKLGPKHEYTFIISLIGFLFSLSWYLVNRASKFWQENWENHIDHLENDIAGPIYKSPIDNSMFKFHKIWEPYSFSISKINQIISLYITNIWLYLTLQNVAEIFNLIEPFMNFNFYILTMITITYIAIIFIKCKSNSSLKKIIFFKR